MSDVSVPSYRVSRHEAGIAGASTRRMLAIAGGVLAIGAVGGAIAWGIGRMGTPRSVPVLEPDARPIKVRPENPGGLIVPNTDNFVLEPPAVRRQMERQQGVGAQLAPGPEAPQLDLLRREAAPPAPPAPSAVAPQPGGPQAAARGGTPAPGGTAPSGTALGGPAATASLPPPRPGQPAPAPGSAAAPAAAPQQLATAARLPPPQPAPVPAAAAPAPAPASGRAMVQLGALPTEEAARAEWARLQRRVPELAGRQPVIARLDRGAEQPPLYRLRAGGLADAAAARTLCESVRAAGGACVPVPGG